MRIETLYEQIADSKIGTLTVIAARPSFGKTTLALQMASELAHKMDTEAVFISLEESKEQIARRGINCSRVNIFESERFEMLDMTYIADKLGNRNKIMVIDYLQLMDCDAKNATNLEKLKSIKRLANKFGIHVLVVSQLSRGIEDNQEGRPMLQGNVHFFDNKTMQEFLSIADNLLLLWRAHEIDRDIGWAHAYDIGNEVEITVGQNYKKVGTIYGAFNQTAWNIKLD